MDTPRKPGWGVGEVTAVDGVDHFIALLDPIRTRGGINKSPKALSGFVTVIPPVAQRNGNADFIVALVSPAARARDGLSFSHAAKKRDRQRN